MVNANVYHHLNVAFSKGKFFRQNFLEGEHMPQVHHVKKARKSRSKHGIRKGQPYWWWWRRAARSRARGVKVFSATRPRPSQLCSGYASDVLAIRERLEDAVADPPTFADALDEAAVKIEAIRDELDERRGNMPEQLQDTGTGEVLAERVEDCEQLFQALGDAADEVRRILADFDEDDATTDGEIDKAVESADEQIKAAWEDVTWPV
jgi:hypothetical protein